MARPKSSSARSATVPPAPSNCTSRPTSPASATSPPTASCRIAAIAGPCPVEPPRGRAQNGGRNIVSDPTKVSELLSPEANQAAALAPATGVLTVDLDAIVANWRKLEKIAVPAECAGVIKADAYRSE